MLEVTLRSTHGDRYQVVVGYDQDTGGYYATVYDVLLRNWNDGVFNMQDDVDTRESFGLVQLVMLDEAVLKAQLDRKTGMQLEELAVLLAMIAEVSDSEFERIMYLKETRH